MAQQLDHPQGECLKEFLVCIFDNTLGAEFESDLRIMKEKFMKVMQNQNLRMKPKVHLLGKYVPTFMHRTGVLLQPTSAQSAYTLRHFRKRVQSEW